MLRVRLWKIWNLTVGDAGEVRDEYSEDIVKTEEILDACNRGRVFQSFYCLGGAVRHLYLSGLHEMYKGVDLVWGEWTFMKLKRYDYGVEQM